ncbi:MAG: ferritin [Fimbriimonadaceae bacterium]
MIKPNLAKLLNEQIGHELEASNAYLGIAAFFGSQSLERWAGYFYKQSEEERMHALKIVTFLVDVEAQVDIPLVPKAKTDYQSGVSAVEWALQNERTVTGQFHKMAEAALAEKDFTTFQFLQWFITEQVEEESSMQKLIDIIKSEPNLFRAEELLPGHPEG